MILTEPDIPWPPGLTQVALDHCPPRLRKDAIQAAWAAHAEGKRPDSGVRQLVRHELRHRAAKPDFDLCPSGSIRRAFR